MPVYFSIQCSVMLHHLLPRLRSLWSSLTWDSFIISEWERRHILFRQPCRVRDSPNTRLTYGPTSECSARHRSVRHHRRCLVIVPDDKLARKQTKKPSRSNLLAGAQRDNTVYNYMRTSPAWRMCRSGGEEAIHWHTRSYNLAIARQARSTLAKEPDQPTHSIGPLGAERMPKEIDKRPVINLRFLI